MEQLKGLDFSLLKGLNDFFTKHSNVFIDKLFAQYLIYLLPLVLVILWFYSQKTKKIVLRVLFAIILAWPILANISGRMINRPRPFEQTGVQELIFHRPDYSFPSDHAAVLFAAAFSFWFFGLKKLAVAFFAIAIVVSFFRVATAIHYPSDILGGFVVGLVAAYLIYLFDKPLDISYRFILKTAQVLHLA